MIGYHSLINKLVSNGYKVVTPKDPLPDAFSSELATLCMALRKKIRGVHFVHRDQRRETFLTFEGDLCASAKIEIRSDYRVGKGYVDVYRVYSDNIRIGKYGDQRYRDSISVPVAVRNISKSLKRIYPVDVVLNSLLLTVGSRVNKIGNKANQGFKETFERMFAGVAACPYNALEKSQTRDVIAEFRSILASSYQPVSQAFREQMEELVLDYDKFIERIQDNERMLHMVAVIPSPPTAREQYYHVIPFHGGQPDKCRKLWDKLAANNKQFSAWDGQIYKPDELPEYLYEKVHVLHVLESEDFVEDVGYRAEGNAYCVIAEQPHEA